MFVENRSRKRFNPDGLVAHIVIDPETGSEIVFDGHVIDMSYSGIKIKLKEPISRLVEQAELNITLQLPESGVTVSIRGKIKHIPSPGQYGLQYTDHCDESDLDDLMFECVKYASITGDD